MVYPKAASRVSLSSMGKILYRYIFKKLWSPFLFGLIGTTLIIALDPMQKALDYVFKNQVDPWIVFEWFYCSVPKDMLFIFPTSSMLAGLLVFSALSKQSELTAVRAGGISFLTCLKPVWLFAMVVFCLVLYVQDQIIPPALKRRETIFRKYIKQHEQPRFRKNVVLRIGGDRLLCIHKMDVQTRELHDVLLYEDQSTMIAAKKATLIEGKRWKLHDVNVSQWLTGFDGGSERKKLNGYRESMEYELNLDKRDLSHYEVKRPQEMSYEEILSLIRYHEERGVLSTNSLWVDFYSKTAFPFASVIFCLLGSALGLSPARGGGFVGFGISLVLSFVYFIIMGFAMPLGKNGLLHPFFAGWAQNFVFLFVTAFTLRKSQGF